MAARGRLTLHDLNRLEVGGNAPMQCWIAVAVLGSFASWQYEQSA